MLCFRIHVHKPTNPVGTDMCQARRAHWQGCDEPHGAALHAAIRRLHIVRARLARHTVLIQEAQATCAGLGASWLRCGRG